ncbi:MAG: cation diffusion facilitator family transporter [Thermoguttaceae bacterium]
MTKIASATPTTVQHQNLAVSAMARITWIGMIVNIFLTLGKFGVGSYAHSQVLIADAVHSLSDLVTDAAVIIGARYWTQPADENHPHGHSKIETLVTLFIGAALAMVGLQLIDGAVESLHTPTTPETMGLPSYLALSVALTSIVVKEILYRATAVVGRRYRSSAVIANAWHHRSDALSSIPAAISIAACMILGPSFAFLDPVGTIVVAAMILYTSWKLAEPTFATLLDVGATRDQRLAIEEVVRTFPDVCGIHKVRTRPLGAGSIAVDLHTEIDGETSVTAAHALSHAIVHKLKSTLPYVVDVVIHIEPFEKT